MRIYIDTSVVGGFYDPEFLEPTRVLFEKVEKDRFTLVVSELLESELLNAPPRVRNILNDYVSHIERVAFSEEAAQLAEEYLREKVVGQTSRTDCQHIAIATLAKVDVLVSWNFKHIVNLKRIRGFNSVNMKLGYALLEIRTPIEILEL